MGEATLLFRPWKENQIILAEGPFPARNAGDVLKAKLARNKSSQSREETLVTLNGVIHR